MNKDIADLFNKINDTMNSTCYIWNSLIYSTGRYKTINVTKAYNLLEDIKQKIVTCQSILLQIQEFNRRINYDARV